MTLVEISAIIALALISASIQGYIGYKLVNSNGDNNIIALARAVAYLAAWMVSLHFSKSPYVFAFFAVPFAVGGLARHLAFMHRYNGYAGWMDTRCIHVVSWAVIALSSVTLIVEGVLTLLAGR